ncbi:flagellin FliC, partial [Escherichia coli]|nr:flagellin FliC [Escherichia coli]
GAQSYDVAADGAVTATTGGATVNIGAEGELTTAANKTVTETYHEFANGNILDDDGAALYKAADGSLTTEATGKSEATTDPLKALDDAIASVDKFRS